MSNTINQAFAAFAALALTYAMFAQAAVIPADSTIVVSTLA